MRCLGEVSFTLTPLQKKKNNGTSVACCIVVGGKAELLRKKISSNPKWKNLQENQSLQILLAVKRSLHILQLTKKIGTFFFWGEKQVLGYLVVYGNKLVLLLEKYFYHIFAWQVDFHVQVEAQWMRTLLQTSKIENRFSNRKKKAKTYFQWIWDYYLIMESLDPVSTETFYSFTMQS